MLSIPSFWKKTPNLSDDKSYERHCCIQRSRRRESIFAGPFESSAFSNKTLEEHEVEKEIERFRDAIEKTKVQMSDIKKRAEKIADKYAVILRYLHPAPG